MANFAPSPPDARAAAAQSARARDKVGDLLARTREEQGGDIDAIATTLRIRAAYLVAIEEARYDRLPGPVYALGFVRSYANYLGLDGDEAVRRFKLDAAGLEQRRGLAFPVPLTPRSVPGGRMLLAAFVLAVCAYGIWHYLSTGDRTRPERVAAVPADLMPPPAPPPLPSPSADAGAAPAAPAPAADAPPPSPDQIAAAAPPSAAPAPAPVTATPLPSPPAGSLVAPPAPPDATVTANASPAAPAAAPPPQPDASPSPALAVTVAATPPGAAPADAAPAPAGPHVFGAIGGPSRITLQAVKDCWIQVRDSDSAQTVVAQRTLHAGDSYRVPVRDGLVLRTGNATGLAVMVDGKPVPALGGTVRNVALDPARLLAGDAGVE